MAAVNPPLFQTVDGEYNGAHLGQPYRDWVREGVVGSGDMVVSQRGAGANMSVDVAAGVAWVLGDSASLQPTYRCLNDATVNLAVDAAHGSLDRVDLVVAEVRDAAFSGVSTDWRLLVITGTPHSSPTPPAVPASTLPLALVSVPASATSVTNGDITDVRPRAQLGAAGGLIPTVTTMPPAPYDGMVVNYQASDGGGVVWQFRYRSGSGDSAKWEFVGGSPLTDVVATDDGTASTSYANIGGPTLTVPLSGVYIVEFGASSYNSGANSNLVSPNFGGGGASDSDAAQADASAANKLATHARMLTGASLSAGTSIRLDYRVTAGTGQFRNRWLKVMPVRVA